MGGPAYMPHPELPPHAPMPGAPPYPAREPLPPPPVGRRPARTRPVAVLGAAAVWAVLNVVLVAASSELVDGARFAAGVGVTTALAVGAGWLVVRRRAWSFWLVLLAVAPIYWVLRALVAAVLG